MAYSKTCKICGTTFESDARNTCYCSDKCAKRGAKKAYRSRKMKHIRARQNGDIKEIETIVQNAYKLSREIAKMCVPKVCGCRDKDHVCSGELVCHHIDHNPLNTHPSNLVWLCEAAHVSIHNEEEDCSIYDEIKSFVVIRKQFDIRQRNAKKRSEKESENND